MNMLAGMTKEELNYKLRELFIRADADNSGGLTRGEFLSCLRSEELNLSRQQINMMMGEFEMDDDGALTYEEFVPIAIDVLVESSKADIEEQQLIGRVSATQNEYSNIQLRCILSCVFSKSCTMGLEGTHARMLLMLLCLFCAAPRLTGKGL